MKKRMSALLIALAMVLSLASCGSAQSKDTESASEAVSSEGQLSTAAGEITALGENTLTVACDDGQERTFTVGTGTAYSMSGMDSGSAPSMPNGEAPNGDAPEMPDGEAPNGDAPEMPDGEAPNGDAPAKPDGEAPNGDAPEMPDGEAPNGDAPEMPDGEAPNGNAPEMPNGEGQGGGAQMTLGFDMLQVGDTVTVTYDENLNATAIEISMSQKGGSGMGGGSASAPTEYQSVKEYSSDTELSGETLESTGDDENAILVTGGNVTADGLTVSRSSESSTGGDNSSFYGVGAAILATGGKIEISDSKIETDAAGGAGAFAYGDGTIYISDSTVTTQKGTSGGIHVAGGGTLYAWDLEVETNGESSAAIRSDRGSGLMVVDGGSYTSNGTGSPAIYSTADISVNDATLTATGSEAICIEGKNSIRLYDCDLSGNMPDLEQNDCTWNVILYQSMSGDSQEGNSTFEMVGGSLTAGNGGMFYTTNTESTFILKDVDITCAENSLFFLKCTGNSNQRGWGSAGSNGADCTFTAIDQEMKGNIIYDSISTLDFYMESGSTLTGAFLCDESNAGAGGSGYANLMLDEDCVWIVTENSTLSQLNCCGTVRDENGKTVSIVGTDGTVYVEGESSLTVTVESYSDSADFSGASVVDSFDDHRIA